MLRKSYGSVEVTWLDRPAVLEATRTAAHGLIARRTEVLKVVLFGSMARGDAVPGSDVDLLVVLTESRENFLDRIPQYKLSGIPIGVDVFPYTETELKRMLEEGNLFVGRAISEGKVLFQRRRPATRE